MRQMIRLARIPRATHVIPRIRPLLYPKDLHTSTQIVSNSRVEAAPRYYDLRPYQIECLDACLEAIERGVHRIGISSPTGSGKTSIFAKLLDRIPSRGTNATRVLILVGSVELARQASIRIKETNPSYIVEIEQGINIASGLADVTVATVQTLISATRLEKFDPSLYKCVIVDEAHHAVASTWLQVLKHFDPTLSEKANSDVEEEAEDVEETQADALHVDEDLEAQLLETSNDLTPMNIMGFSATLTRHDGLALEAAFDEVVYHKDFIDMINEKWLSPVRFTTINSKVNLAEVKVSTATGEFVPSSLAQVLDNPEVTSLIVKAWKEKASDRKTTLVFGVNVAHSEALAAEFRQIGVESRVLVGTTHAKLRTTIMEDFRDGKYPVLVNCAILTEGADIPGIDCVLLVRPTLSRNLFSQMIGRGLRLSPDTGKSDCLILDVIGNLRHGLVCSPSLFGLPAYTDLDGTTAEELQEMSESQPRDANSMSGAVGDELDYKDLTVEELLGQGSTTGSLPLHRMSPNHWVSCGQSLYVLELFTEGFIRVRNTGSGYMAMYTRQIPPMEDNRKFVYAKPIPIMPEPEEDLDRIIHTCDTWVKQRNSGLGQLVLRSAAWRQKPATEKQKNYVKKRLGDDTASFLARVGPNVAVSTLTKGQASTIMALLNHGAKGRLEKLDKAYNKEQSKLAKEKQKQERQQVKIGRLGRAG